MGHNSYFACVGSPWAAASLRAHTPAPAWGPPQAAVWISCLVCFSMGCRGTTWSTMVFSMAHRGICSSAYSSSSSPLTLGSTELFLLHFSYSSFLQLLRDISYLFLSFLRHAMPSSLLFGSAVSCGASVLELVGTSCF